MWRPLEIVSSEAAAIASVVGARLNTIATPVASLIRSVTTAQAESSENTSPVA